MSFFLFLCLYLPSFFLTSLLVLHSLHLIPTPLPFLAPTPDLTPDYLVWWVGSSR